MLNEFKQYLLSIGKSENTTLNYCDKHRTVYLNDKTVHAFVSTGTGNLVE